MGTNVDASHDRRQVVVRLEGGLVALSDDRQRRVESSEAWLDDTKEEVMSATDHRHGPRREMRRTSDGQLGRSSDELEELPSDGRLVGGHDLDQVSDRARLDVVSVVGLEDLAQS